MRYLVLTIGPLIIVGLSYSLTLHGRDDPETPRLPTAAADQATPDPGTAPTRQLELECQQQATAVRRQFSGEHHLIVRPPYIIAGDLDTDKLDRYHQLLIVPTQRALSTDYLDKSPNKPITVVLLSSDEAFAEFAGRNDRRSVNGEYGYYFHGDRRLVINAATGNGTLAHELTHALTQFDFPAIPAWFDEGLAAVHEGCEFSDDGLHLSGLSNWRINVLCEAIRQSRLDSIETLIAKEKIAKEQADVDYAHARYFCLYLQNRRLLAPFYRKFRRAVESDPTGIETLRSLLQVNTLAKTNADFQSWALSLGPSAKPDD